MLSVLEAQEKIQKEGEVKNVQEMRYIEKMEVGQVVRQGDIYIHCVKSNHPCGKVAKTNQLAMGTSKGSRHIAEGVEVFDGTTLPKWCAPNTFLGPRIKAKDRFIITHPEHAYFSLPAGDYQVTHQMDARTLRRVQD